MSSIRWLFAVLFGLALTGAGAAVEPAGKSIRETQDKFDSGGKSIPVERFEPKGEGKFPGIVLVHGADSLTDDGWLKFYRGLARDLAAKGYVVVMPHYLNRTDTKVANGPAIAQHFAAWSQTVGDAVNHLSGLTNVDGKRLGLVGASLGASLILTESAFDPRIGATVEYFGTLPDWVPGAAARVKRQPLMPPILILHGDKDVLVKVQEAHKLERYLKDKELTYDIKIYPGQGHGFRDEALKDSTARTIAFFDKYLKK